VPRLGGICLRFRSLAIAALLAGCAGAPARPSVEAEELKELRSQIQAQSALVAQQQHRIEELEVKLAALAARAHPAAAHPAPAPPARPDPRPPLKTVKAGGRLRRADRINPVEHAPRLPVSVELRDPDENALALLGTDPAIAREFDADHTWAEAVRKLNEGRHAEAEIDLLAFVAAWPDHTAADNALYLAGLVREVRGDCAGALPLFESVPQKYPAGDAVRQAQLERGRCLRILGRKDEAKSVLGQLSTEHPDAPEAAQSRQLLLDL
jgi:TolA-binding protein